MYDMKYYRVGYGNKAKAEAVLAKLEGREIADVPKKNIRRRELESSGYGGICNLTKSPNAQVSSLPFSLLVWLPPISGITNARLSGACRHLGIRHERVHDGWCRHPYSKRKWSGICVHIKDVAAIRRYLATRWRDELVARDLTLKHPLLQYAEKV